MPDEHAIAGPRPAASVIADLVSELEAFLGDRVTTSEAACEHHATDLSYHPVAMPDAVAYPRSTEEVSQIVRACAARNVPIVPFGTGTSLEGHLAALRGGVSLDLSQMNSVLEVNAEDMDCHVEPGVTRNQLNQYLRDTGLFFPIDPGADASLGGMAATRASGTNAVRYGTMRENVLGLTVVLADGSIIETGTRAKKSAAGYDLTKLFVGSEGTLGVITGVRLRLYGIPEATSSATVRFADLEAAVNTVIAVIQWGIPVARIELLDEVMVDAINRYSKLDLPLMPSLFMEFHGSDAGVAEQAERVGSLCDEFGGDGFQWTADPDERATLWRARHNAALATQALRPGSKLLNTDVCVPISRLADCIMETRADLDAGSLTSPIVGHVGDGNFHCVVVIGPDDPEKDIAEAEVFNTRLVERALSMGGTCTGEHGVGQGKMQYLKAEHGESLAVMRTLKHALDPNNLMNPGKIFSFNALDE